MSLELKKKVESPLRKAIPALKTSKPTYRLRHQSIPVHFFLFDTDGSRRSRVNEARSAEDKELLISTGFNISS